MDAKRNLVKAIQAWRLADGKNDKPMGWQKWAKSLGMVHTVLFRFCKDGGDNTSTLGTNSLHKLATRAKENEDYTTIMALAEYALGVEITPRMRHMR